MKHFARALLIVASGLMAAGCDKEENPVKSQVTYQADLAVPYAGYSDSVRVCTWKDDKRAAYSVAFDDATRSSHYLVSAPELEARGMRGTFNLNTKGITDWEPWQKLFDKGHELASHSWSHLRMGDLDEIALHREFSLAKSDLLNHIKGLKEVPSFTFPMGSSSALARAVALQYHRSARAGSGVNAAVLTQEELSRVKGVGVYPPYDMSRFEAPVNEALERGGWVLIYFHTVSAAEESGDTTIPLSFYRAHLDYVKIRADQFWLATQGEAATYLYAREATDPQLTMREERILQITMAAPNLRGEEAGSLSVVVRKPEEWRDHAIVVELDGAILTTIAASPSEQFVCDLPVNKTVWLWARK